MAPLERDDIILQRSIVAVCITYSLELAKANNKNQDISTIIG